MHALIKGAYKEAVKAPLYKFMEKPGKQKSLRLNEMEEIDYLKTDEKFKTGNIIQDDKFVIYPFDKYEIVIRLTPDDRFLGISEISFNKNYLSFKRKEYLPPLFNLDEEYPEETSD